ncbi:MAG: S1 RNA-binding domain-containing protein [bacterium]|nr:S1 RNA-binding domain-containing protein [bacterium]
MENITEEHGDAIDMEHVADSAMDNIQPGMIVQGEIVTIDTEYAYVNVGTKSDGRIPVDEFETKPEVGDVIDVILKSPRLVEGMYEFSKNAAEMEKKWQNFLKWYKEGNNSFSGKVLSATNKGKLVDCMGISGFLPFSLAADLKGESEPGDDYNFKIKSIDEKKRSIILSRKEFLDEETKVRWESFLTNYKAGDRIEGEVVKFVEFGVFVNVAGIDALLHRNDMSWKNVFKQRKLLKIGESREFIILNVNEEERKISLGLKQLTEDPWLRIDEKYKIGDAVAGKVVTLVNVGAFIEIEEGVEGFINNSDLSWTKDTVNVKDFLEKGQELEVQILDINKEERKLSLGLKQLAENPWDSIGDRISVGDVYKKKVKKIVKFGMFVELEDNIDGLIHVSDVTWDDGKKDLAEIYSVGDEVEFKILDIKKDKMKISCGIKQLQKSPWEVISEKYPPRKVVSGFISGITKFGVFVKLEDEVEGLIHISELSKARIEDLEDHFKVGEKIDAVVLSVDIEKKRLSLSKKSYDIISEKEELEKILKDTSSSTPTLGDILKINLGE